MSEVTSMDANELTFIDLNSENEVLDPAEQRRLQMREPHSLIRLDIPEEWLLQDE